MLLPEQNEPCEIDSLISEYLDTDAAPARIAELSKLLESRKDFREQFVAQVQMHGMLCNYFKTHPPKAAEPSAVEASDDVMPPRRRKRRSKRNAA